MQRLMADAGDTDVRCASVGSGGPVAVGAVAMPAHGDLASSTNPPRKPHPVYLATFDGPGLRGAFHHRFGG